MSSGVGGDWGGYVSSDDHKVSLAGVGMSRGEEKVCPRG